MTVRIFFAVNVHGSTGVWRKWLRAPEFYKADIIMLCGDLIGKGMVPLIEEKRGYLTTYYGRVKLLRTERELQQIEERISMAGMYPIRCSQEEVDALQHDPHRVEQLLRRMILTRMRQWMDELVERVDLRKTTVIVMPGNDDDPAVDEATRSYRGSGVVWPLDGPVEIAGFELVSLAHVNPTPWDTPREASEEEPGSMIDSLVARLTVPRKAIFNFHAPPYGTGLDLAPRLRRDLTPVMGPGRSSIARYRPLIGLHGHIHESAGQDRVEGVPVVNPGSEYGENILRGVLIEADRDGIGRFWRVEG